MKPDNTPDHTPGAADPPMYHTEEMLWANQQLYPRAGTYHVPFGFAIEGEVDVAALQRAVDVMIAQHGALRTTFVAREGRPARAPHAALPLAVARVAVAAGESLPGVVQGLCQEPFDLAAGPLWRVALVEGEGERLLLFVVHHIVFDEASIAPFTREFFDVYDRAARKVAIDPTPRPQFVDYVRAKGPQSAAARDADRTYWKQQISKMERLIELPFYRCPNDERRFRGGRLRLALAEDAARGLAGFCAASGLGQAPVMLAGFKALLYRYFGTTDVTVVSPVDDRDAVGFPEVIGFAGNVLPSRLHLRPDESFRGLVERVRAQAEDIRRHAELPLNDVVQILRGEEAHVTEAPFHVLFELKEERQTRWPAGKAVFASTPVDNGLAKMPLSLTAVRADGKTTLEWEFNRHVFDQLTISELAGQYSALLGRLCAEPDRPLGGFELSIEPRRALGNRPVFTSQAFRHFPKAEIEQSIVDRFEAQVEKYRAKVAVQTEERTYTYGELSESSTRLARRLLREAGAPGARYALCFEHGATFPAAVLGALKARGAYVPLDTTFPKDRLAYVLRDAGASAIVADDATIALARELARDAGVPAVNLSDVERDAEPLGAPLPRPEKNDLAYILYTSGSTGQPKGVAQSHRNVLHHMRMWTNSLRITEYDHHTLFSAYPWDSSVQDLLGSLLNGATVFPRNLRETDLSSLPAWLRDNAISVVHTTIPLFRRFAKALPAGEVVDTVRAIALGGDAMHKGDLELFKAHFSAQCNLVNMYGATESSSALFFVAGHDTEIDGEVVPLGFPPEDTSVVLVRNGVEQRAHSIVGEIAIKSEHVALGYWNADASTKERFLPDPANPARRVYLTGDLGRVLPSGAVEYVGRKDFQVKIRGFRVGLGEVEAFLAEHPAVKDVVVVANEEVGEEKELVAYYVLADVPERPAPRELREFMLSKVPDYMVPRFLMDISSLPLTARGKIDRASLPKPHQEEPSDEPRARNYERPRSDVERTLARIWEDLLGVKPVGIRDNFFALGGHSMLGFQMFDRVKAEFGVSVPPVALYRGAATVELLAIQVETKRQAQAAAAT